MNLLPTHIKNPRVTLLALSVLSSLVLSIVATSFDFARATSHSISLHGHAHDDDACSDLIPNGGQSNCSSESGQSHQEHGFCQTIIALQIAITWQLEPVAAALSPGEFVLRRLIPKMSEGGPGEPPEFVG